VYIRKSWECGITFLKQLCHVLELMHTANTKSTRQKFLFAECLNWHTPNVNGQLKRRQWLHVRCVASVRRVSCYWAHSKQVLCREPFLPCVSLAAQSKEGLCRVPDFEHTAK